MLGRISETDLATLSPAPVALSRRSMLKAMGLAGAAGFVVGWTGMPGAAHAAAPGPVEGGFMQFIKIGIDNTVVVLLKHLDKGQGVTTGLTTIVAEELDADWSQMRWEFAPANAALYKNLYFGVQGTGGSTSIANSWMQLRQAAAAARAMLLQAAADEMKVPMAELTIEKGIIKHASGKSMAFGGLAQKAAALTPPKEPKLKDPKDFRLIGTKLPRIDSPQKTNGTAMYTLDAKRPGMLTAVVAHPPRFGATVKSLDAAAAKDIPGVVDVVQIPRGVAVLADGMWAALKGRDALNIEWDTAKAENRSTDQLLAEYRDLLKKPGLVARNTGDADKVLSNPGTKVVETTFSFPYLAHASMEPLNAVVELKPDGVEIWTASQLQTVDQMVAAGIAGVTPDKVVIHTLLAGGSFGRRAVPDSDFIAEAVMIAKAINGKAPVKLQWTREDDMRGGRYRPMSAHVIRDAVDQNGNIIAWHHRLAIQSFLAGTPFQGLIKEGVDGTAVEGARGLPYAIANVRVEAHHPEVGVPTL